MSGVRNVGLSGLLVAALASSVCALQAPSLQSCAPQKTVWVARPFIECRVEPVGTELEDAWMTINGQEVRMLYDLADGTLRHTPDRPLPAGSYEVALRVAFPNGAVKDVKWSFSVAPGAIESLPEFTPLQVDLLAEANRYRRQMGLPLFRLDPRLCAAAQAHSEYLARNRAFGHSEDPAKPGFVGTGLGERASAFGFQGGLSECISSGGMAGLVCAPYHRMPFMSPGQCDLGIGLKGNILTMDFGGRFAEGVVVYPTPGQRDVPVRFYHESPDPLRIHGKPRNPGFAVILVCSARQPGPFRVLSASLSTGGQAIPVYRNTPDNDECLRNGVILIPQQPLKQGQTYQARIEFQVGNGPRVVRAWAFQTAFPAGGRTTPGRASTARAPRTQPVERRLEVHARLLPDRQTVKTWIRLGRNEPAGRHMIHLLDKDNRILLAAVVDLRPGVPRSSLYKVARTPILVEAAPLRNGEMDTSRVACDAVRTTPRVAAGNRPRATAPT